MPWLFCMKNKNAQISSIFIYSCSLLHPYNDDTSGSKKLWSEESKVPISCSEETIGMESCL